MSEEQHNQSTGIVGEIVDGLHNLEEKVDHLIHGDGAPSSSEPGTDPNWTPAQLAEIQAAGVAPMQINQIAEAGGAVAGESASGALAPATGTSATVETGSASSALTATLASESQAASSLNPADAPAVAASGEGLDAHADTATASLTGTDVNANVPSDGSSGQTVSGDDPNAAAPTAGDSSASDTQSSASPVSQVGVGLAIAASVSEAIASRVYTLRKHFWTFDEVTRAPFIKLLDEIEALVK